MTTRTALVITFIINLVHVVFISLVIAGVL